MSFQEQATLAEDQSFRNRVRQAVCFAAMNVMGEVKPPEMSDTHAGKRAALADSILRSGGAQHVDAFAWLVSVFNGGIIQANAPDNDIQFAVNSLFDDMSGVRLSDG